MDTCRSDDDGAPVSKPAASRSGRDVRTVALVGLPNTGKSQTFNELTGEYTLVANYANTTLETHRKTVVIGDGRYEIIDTPGLHSLYVHSEEELTVRDLLFRENPDVVVQCIDANLLKQSLVLTADLLELQIPLVVCLNAVDETNKRGIWIDTTRLSRLLGVPVVEGGGPGGAAGLRRAIVSARRGRWEVRQGDLIERAVEEIATVLPPQACFGRKLATLSLLGDELVGEYVKTEYGDVALRRVQQVVAETRRAFRGNLTTVMNTRKKVWLDEVVAEVVRAPTVARASGSDAVARASRHPVFGPLILFGLVYACFFLVVHGANGLADTMHELIWLPTDRVLTRLLPGGFWHDLIIGDYGLLSFGVANALLTVLPILSVFFLLYNLIEDTGYIPNASVMTQGVLGKLGLTGAAIMPLVLGFGCKTMATMTTRTLPSKKERYIAIYLIAFAIPCAPQLGLSISILGRMGFRPFSLICGVLFLAEVGVGLVLNRLIREDAKSAYLQQLPPIRLPSPRAVLRKTSYRLTSFVKEALPAFVGAAAILFGLHKVGLLDGVKHVLTPVVRGFLGLPLDMVDALILCLARKEAAAGVIIRLVDSGQLNWVQTSVSVVLTIMFFPCFANVVTIVRELGYRKAVPMLASVAVGSVVLSGLLNWVLAALTAGA